VNDIIDGVVDVVSMIAFVSGALLALVASVALHRLTGTRSRMHATTKPATLGVLLCALGATLQLSDASNITKVVVIVVLQLATAPIGAHMFGRSVGEK
jgi:multicomponent Na+:H+ antiporter subunit G